MATAVEIEKLALKLSEEERATLAANLLESLPGVSSDERSQKSGVRRGKTNALGQNSQVRRQKIKARSQKYAGNPWVSYAGIWKDHPDVHAVMENIAEYRRTLENTSSTR